MSKELRESLIQRRKFVLDAATPFQITEAYKTARTNLMFSISTLKKKSIVFASCSPSEGKTTTAVNMAITLSEMGARVLLIDADMRKSMVHNLLELGNKLGLSSILGGFCNLGDALSANPRWKNLDIITAGHTPPNPAELLSSQNMANMLEVLSDHYDYILIDTPPVNLVTDSQLMNDLIAGIVFVVRENSTTHMDLQDALRRVELAKGHILGFMKVDCHPNYRGYRGFGYKKRGEFVGGYKSE